MHNEDLESAQVGCEFPLFYFIFLSYFFYQKNHFHLKKAELNKTKNLDKPEAKIIRIYETDRTKAKLIPHLMHYTDMWKKIIDKKFPLLFDVNFAILVAEVPFLLQRKAELHKQKLLFNSLLKITRDLRNRQDNILTHSASYSPYG